MKTVHSSALGLIGKTPLIALERIHRGPGKIYAKGEFMQPGGSVKDRVALWVIKEAYRTGQLREGQAVVEMTSGNMGAGLAVVCNIFGNPFTAVMPAGNSHARARILRSLGAEVILTSQVDGEPGQVTGADIGHASIVAAKLARKRKGFYVDQFNSSGSVAAHAEGTGPEIWAALGGRLDAFVMGVGSGGTFVGTSLFLKEKNSRVLCVPVEPKGAEILATKTVTKVRHLLQGIGYGFVPKHWDPKLAELGISVSDEEAIKYKELLAHAEGLNVGFSSAANVCASVKFTQMGLCGPTPTVVTILCDTGMKY
ncbi:MAG: PLP-dependent cysteine synthase family protein [Pyrinomonadaceae bacterium]